MNRGLWNLWSFAYPIASSMKRQAKRTETGRIGRLECLEARLLLTPWDTNWQYGPPPGEQPPNPHPYDFSKFDDSCIIEVPDVGGVPVDAKVNGNSLKGKLQSGNITGTIKFKGNFANSQTPSDGDTFTGKVKVKITEPGSKPQRINLKVVGQHVTG